MNVHGGRAVAAAGELGCGVDDALARSASIDPFAPDERAATTDELSR